MKRRFQMTMSMLLLHVFVWMTCIWVSRHIVSVVLKSSQNLNPAWETFSIMPGILFASFFLWSIKLPDGRYLFRQWEGDNLQFATPMQLVLFCLTVLVLLALPIYWLFWY